MTQTRDDSPRGSGDLRPVVLVTGASSGIGRAVVISGEKGSAFSTQTGSA